MIYNFNLGIGWASSGVEYAQKYRANVFRRIGAPAKFLFMDMFPTENIEHLTSNLGFLDEEVLWLYTFFTDNRIQRVSYTLKDVEESLPDREYTYCREGKTGKILFGGNDFYTLYFVNETEELVHRMELVSKGCLIRKDYFTDRRVYSEYYAPLDGRAHLYQRRFFHQDGTTAYEELIDNDFVTYRMKDAILYSKEELVGYLVRSLKLTREDIVLVDRATGIGQAILENASPARIGVIIHADHFSENSANEDRILWNNYYEYMFHHHKHVDFYVTATEAQKKLLEQQFVETYGICPKVYAIPVGSIDSLTKEETGKPCSLITASRLASEKHIDWLIRAVSLVHETYQGVTLDIYGEGKEEAVLRQLIEECNAKDYIRLMGQHDLSLVYPKYQAYVAASLSEGFGLTLLEAVGAGLAMIGFDVRYGNPTFIADGKNGYLLPDDKDMTGKQRVELLKEAICRMFEKDDIRDMKQASYEIAKEYLTEKVEAKWKNLISEQQSFC